MVPSSVLQRIQNVWIKRESVTFVRSRSSWQPLRELNTCIMTKLQTAGLAVYLRTGGEGDSSSKVREGINIESIKTNMWKVLRMIWKIKYQGIGGKRFSNYCDSSTVVATVGNRVGGGVRRIKTEGISLEENTQQSYKEPFFNLMVSNGL